MSTSVIQTTNRVLTDHTSIFGATANGDFFWLTQGVVGATNSTFAAYDGNFNNISMRIDGQLLGTIGIETDGVGAKIAVGATGTVLSNDPTNESIAVYLNGISNYLTNDGTIYSSDGIGVSVQSPKGIVQNSGTITGYIFGVYLDGSVPETSLINHGVIRGGHADLATVQVAAVIVSTKIATIDNFGTVSGVGTNGDGVLIGNTSVGPTTTNVVLRNFASGLIHSAEAWGIDASSTEIGSPTVINRGHIEGADGSVRGGNAGMTLRNWGTLDGNVDLAKGAVQFVNRGVVDGDVSDSGALTVMRNLGTITGSVAFGLGADNFTNKGTVEGDVRLGNTGSTYNGALGHVLGKIFGGTGADLMIGSADDETFDASASSSRVSVGDTIRAGAGDDVMIASNGKDLLTGGLGADVFRFVSSAAAGVTPANSDTITDFTHLQDLIDLRSFMAGGSFVANAALGGTAKLVNYVAATGLISGDVDGNGSADWTLHIRANTVLTAADFVF